MAASAGCNQLYPLEVDVGGRREDGEVIGLARTTKLIIQRMVTINKYAIWDVISRLRWLP